MASLFGALIPRVIAVAIVALFATATLTFAANARIATPPSPTVTPAVVSPPTLVVPAVTGQAYVFAKGMLEDAGFAWRLGRGAPGYAGYRVVSQFPAAGTRVIDTGAPTMVLRVAADPHYHGAGHTPDPGSPYAGTAVRLAALASAPAAPLAKHAGKVAAKKPAAKKAAAKKPAAKMPAAKKPAAKKVTAKKPAAKAVVAKKVVVKKPAAKKVAAKKPAAKAVVAKKVAVKKPAAKKVAAKKPAAKAVVAKKVAVKEPAAKKVAAKKVTAKKPAAKTVVAKKVVAKKPAAKKVTAKRPAAKKAAAKKVAGKKPAVKKAAAKKRVHSATSTKAKAKVRVKAGQRPPAFVLAGSKREPLNEMPLTDRARLLAAWVATHRQPTAANVQYWLYQHAWIVTGARFGWWHGAEALRALIKVDHSVEREWGIGSRSEWQAHQTLSFVRAHSS